MRFFILVLFLLVSTSCVSQKKSLNSWIGLDKHQLILSWGPPSRVADDGSGGEILIYGHHIYSSYYHLNYWDYKMIYVDKDGKIYHWRTTREQVPPTDVNVTLL